MASHTAFDVPPRHLLLACSFYRTNVLGLDRLGSRTSYRRPAFVHHRLAVCCSYCQGIDGEGKGGENRKQELSEIAKCLDEKSKENGRYALLLCFVEPTFQKESAEIGESIEVAVEADISVAQLYAVFHIGIGVALNQVVERGRGTILGFYFNGN